MASIYTKDGSAVLWIRYKDESGKWKGKPTSYRAGNLGEKRQAELMARRQSEIEKTRTTHKSAALEEWVLPWLLFKYGGSPSTLAAYKRYWRTVGRFLEKEGIRLAGQVKREFAQAYMLWRTGDQEQAGRNSAIYEIKLLSMVIDEAIHRGHCTANPLRKLGLKKDRSQGKAIWTNEQMAAVAQHVEKTKTHWQQVTFYFGLFQACRLRQCQVPLDCIRLDLGVIQYPDIIVKGGQAFSQPIDGRFLPILERLMHTARKMGLKRICDVKWDASLIWRMTLDRCGFEEICHHGLRATWITRAAENAVPESQAMAFCHHQSAEVHRIYKKVSVASIVHVPALVPLPSFGGLPPARPALDALPATPDNAEAESSSRTPSRTRDRARNRRRFVPG